MEEHKYLVAKLFGTDIAINIPSVINTLITATLTFVIVMFITSRVKLRPDSKRQNTAELLAEFVKNNTIANNISWTKYGKSLWAFGLTIFSFVLIANTIGVLFEVTSDEVVYVNSITADPTTTLALAGLFIIFTHYYGIKNKGVKFYLNTYTSYGVWLSPLKVMEEFTNLLTLSLRLFGNIYAGEILIGMLTTVILSGWIGGIFGTVGLIVWKLFSLMIGAIQAYVFTLLIFSYLSHKINEEH